MDTWESFFREKSRRRAAFRGQYDMFFWIAAGAGFLFLVTAIVAGVNLL
jgi:hypothetical protein